MARYWIMITVTLCSFIALYLSIAISMMVSPASEDSSMIRLKDSQI